MVDQFIELQNRIGDSHHCGHYGSFMRDFVVCDARGQPVPPPNFGAHPLGIWPTVLPFYSRSCPIVMSFFAKIDASFKSYFDMHKIHLIGVSLSVKIRENGTNYYIALIFGTDNSSKFVCSNQKCEDCTQSFKIDFYARTLHVNPPHFV